VGRGSISDRPWGVTLCALAREPRSVTLTLHVEDEKDRVEHRSPGREDSRDAARVFQMVIDRGHVIAASSPWPADAAPRVALTSHLITPAQLADVKRRIAAAPGIDEVDVLAAAARLGPEQVHALRQRLALQRAARTFAVERGTYEIAALPGAAARGDRPDPLGVDLRAVSFAGARLHLAPERLSCELRQLGARFALRAERVSAEELARFGFSAAEEPVLEALRAGTSLPELEASHRDLDPRVIAAVMYALAAHGALDPVEPLAPAAPLAAPRLDREPVAVGRRGTTHGPVVAPRAPSPRAGSPNARRPITEPALPPEPPAPPRTATGTGTGATGLRTASPRGPRLPLPLPAPRTRTEDAVPGIPASGVPVPVDAHGATTVRAAVPRAMLDSFRTGRITAVRPNALAATEVVALITERVALLDAGCDHFALLGLPVGAPIEDVHAAYVELSRHLRPKRLADLGIVDEGFAAHRLLAQLGIAFTVLTDRIRRPEYIATLRTAQRHHAART
jgi:hypothetical protein